MNVSDYLINGINFNIVLLAAILALLFLVFFLYIKLRRLTRAHKSLMQGMSGKNLEEMLETYLSKARHAEAKVNELEQMCNKLSGYAQKSLQNFALIRFNAFDNMGSDLSFATAFLDRKGDGLVISSINSRDESRVYAKPITNLSSSYHLSQEEELAIKQAMERQKI